VPKPFQFGKTVLAGRLRWNSSSVIFAHNHPSGVAEPSHADEVLTQSLKQSLALVDIKVLDHFVVAGTAALSFAERGLV
jgi:DNA repair protein RadC